MTPPPPVKEGGLRGARVSRSAVFSLLRAVCVVWIAGSACRPRPEPPSEPPVEDSPEAAVELPEPFAPPCGVGTGRGAGRPRCRPDSVR